MTDFLPSKKTAFVITAVIALGIIYLNFRPHQSPPTVASVAAPRVETIIARADNTPIPLDIAGFVRSDRQADIAPATSGRVARIHRREGDLVKRGDVLVTLSDITAESQVSVAQTQVAALKRTLEDSERYNRQLVDEAKDDDTATEESIKSAKRARDLNIRLTKNQLVAAEGALAVARSKAKELSVTAPFAGTVKSVLIRVGDFATYGRTILSIASPGDLEIETTVSATDGRLLIPGLPVTLTATDGRPVNGTLSAVAPGSDSRSQKTFVRVRLTDATDTVRLGDFLHGTIFVPRTDSIITLPRKAVISRGGDSVVFTVSDDSVAREHTIELGKEHDGRIEIPSGIDEGERVVVSGQNTLTDSMKVTPYATE